jgi:hypothetical protein
VDVASLKRVETTTKLTLKTVFDSSVVYADNYGSITAMLRTNPLSSKVYNIVVVAEGEYANWTRDQLLAEGEMMLSEGR